MNLSYFDLNGLNNSPSLHFKNSLKSMHLFQRLIGAMNYWQRLQKNQKSSAVRSVKQCAFSSPLYSPAAEFFKNIRPEVRSQKQLTLPNVHLKRLCVSQFLFRFSVIHFVGIIEQTKKKCPPKLPTLRKYIMSSLETQYLSSMYIFQFNVTLDQTCSHICRVILKMIASIE